MIKQPQTEIEWVNENLPKAHNEQDIVYLKARFQWINAPKGETKQYWEKCTQAYQGTTFDLKRKRDEKI